MSTNNVTNNNPFSAVPLGQSLQVQNSTEGESTTSQVAKRKLEEFQEMNPDLAQQNPEGKKHQKIEGLTPTEILPYELWMYLFSFADFKTLSSLRGVSKEFRKIVHKTLEYGLRVMDPSVLNFIGKASETWQKFPLTVMVPPPQNGSPPEEFDLTVEDQKTFNLNPVLTEFFTFTYQPVPITCRSEKQIAIEEWDDMLRVSCIFLERAPSLKALDLSNIWNNDKNEEESVVDSHHLDFGRIISNVSPTLEYLDASHNSLEVSAVFGILKTHGLELKTLLLNNTQIQNDKNSPEVDLNDLPKTLRSLKLDSLDDVVDKNPFQLTGNFPTSLTKLSLADNMFLEISLPALPSSLKYLNLSAMRIPDSEGVPMPFFEERTLSIIRDFPFQSLKILILKNNFLMDDDLQVIMQNPDSSLEKIDLSENFINLLEIDPETFRFPSRLEHLNLESNAIHRLHHFYPLLLNHVLRLLRAKKPISLKKISIKKNRLDPGVLEELKKVSEVKELFEW
jgi:hypothetical protein